MTRIVASCARKYTHRVARETACLITVLGLVAGLSPSTVFAHSVPRPDPVVTQTAIPIAATPSTSCGSAGCDEVMLRLLDHDRAVDGNLPPLTLARRQTAGSASCVGSYGHSAAMARSGSIWHENTHFPHASFPANICLTYRTAAENVGESSSGNVLEDLQVLDRLMMSEPHGESVCAETDNHACNILNPSFRHVGIGIYIKQGVTWLTEDFVG